MRFSGRLDLDTFDTSLLPEGFEATPDELCDLIEVTAQIECVPCTDGRVRCGHLCQVAGHDSMHVLWGGGTILDLLYEREKGL